MQVAPLVSIHQADLVSVVNRSPVVATAVVTTCLVSVVNSQVLAEKIQSVFPVVKSAHLLMGTCLLKVPVVVPLVEEAEKIQSVCPNTMVVAQVQPEVPVVAPVQENVPHVEAVVHNVHLVEECLVVVPDYVVLKCLA